MDLSPAAPDAIDDPGVIDAVLTAPDTPTGIALLTEYSAALTASLSEELAIALKAEADVALRADLPRAEHFAQLLFGLAEVTGNPLWRALGLRALGNIESIGKREFAGAVRLYDNAAEIYRGLGQDVFAAEALVGKVGALAILGRYDDAFDTAASIGPVLEAHERWPQYITLMLNMGLIYNRLRDDVAALRVFDQARGANQRLDGMGAPTLMMIENNRAIHLRNLGRYQEALQAGDAAHALAEQLGYSAENARIEHNQAYIWTALGNYTRALQLFASARKSLFEDGRTRDVLMVDADMIECWLSLGRYDRVIDICRQTRPLFARSEAHLEIASVILCESIAQVQLGRLGEALETIDEAAQHFAQANNQVYVTAARLEAAVVYYLQAEYAASLQLALACMQAFHRYSAPVEYAKASLVAARAAMALGMQADAARYVDEALASAHDMTTLTCQAYFLRGLQAETGGNLDAALSHYDRAIAEIERLRGNVMVEFRSSFVADKQGVYESAARCAIALGDAPRGLQYVERCKSRALIDLLSCRLDLSIRARAPADDKRVCEINALCVERDRQHRRWELQRVELRAGEQTVGDSIAHNSYQIILQLERQITDKWHDLLVHNADYARDGALWQAQAEPIQPCLDDDTALVEYFSVGGRFHAFIVTTQGVEVRPMPAHTADIESARQKLGLNFKAVTAMPHKAASLAANGRKILQQLNQALFAPLQDAVQPYARVIMVPHGCLHGLPMHAFHDGESYLLERHEVCYLPSAGVLRYCRERRIAPGCEYPVGSTVAFACSNKGRLSGVVHEAQMVATRMGGHAYVEEEATLARLREQVVNSNLIHLATHAEFSAGNPLFSCLTLCDGALTALDIFNLRLNASLVTLSACQTGESAVGGGDELEGLTRAFLYAGAASLVLSGWKVNDAFTAELMDRFYTGLAAGRGKGQALREAQLEYVQNAPAGDAYAHPQFWAGFCLVGDWGMV